MVIELSIKKKIHVKFKGMLLDCGVCAVVIFRDCMSRSANLSAFKLRNFFQRFLVYPGTKFEHEEEEGGSKE